MTTTRPKRITNKQIPEMVAAMQIFRNGSSPALESCFAEWVTHRNTGEAFYVVYSYTATWPIAIYSIAFDCWFVNDGKISQTTSRHTSLVLQGISMSSHNKIIPVSVAEAVNLLNVGPLQHTRDRLSRRMP